MGAGFLVRVVNAEPEEVAVTQRAGPGALGGPVPDDRAFWWLRQAVHPLSYSFPKARPGTSSKTGPHLAVMQSLCAGLILRNEKLPRDHLTGHYFNGYLLYPHRIIPLVSTAFFNFPVVLKYFEIYLVIYAHY